MTDYKFSVVMPVYNTKAEYLECAVDSVLKQTYGNFELLIVDDGSTDDCARLCDEIQKRDARIKVLHQKNAGVSTARNNGADMACGEYLMYMDSDDILAAAALQEAAHVIAETEAPFIFAGLTHIRSYEQFQGTDGSQEVQFHLFEKEEMDFVLRSFFTQRNAEFMNVRGGGAFNRGPCARVLRMDLAKAIRFESSLIIGEDVEWNMRVLRACEKVCFVNSLWYGYLQLADSAIHKYYGNRAESLEAYHNLLYQRNKEFCEKDPVPYAINMAISFYSMVKCEYLSAQCPLSGNKKRKEIKKILSRSPWTVMLKKNVFSKLPSRHKVFLIACKMGLGVEMLKLWGMHKNGKQD